MFQRCLRNCFCEMPIKLAIRKSDKPLRLNERTFSAVKSPKPKDLICSSVLTMSSI